MILPFATSAASGPESFVVGRCARLRGEDFSRWDVRCHVDLGDAGLS